MSHLSGHNHHALVHAQQLALMARLFIDLCKPPESGFSRHRDVIPTKETAMARHCLPVEQEEPRHSLK